MFRKLIISGKNFRNKTKAYSGGDQMARGGARTQQQGQGEDDVTETDTQLAVKDRFAKFLLEYRTEKRVLKEVDGDEKKKRPKRKYYELLKRMIAVEATTLPVDFRDVEKADAELADAVLTEYSRFDSYIRDAAKQALEEVRRASGDQQVEDEDGPWTNCDIFIAFHSLPAHRPVLTLRELRSSVVGQLVAVRATVTRSTETRPELLRAKFNCMKCTTATEFIEQQLRFTLPTVCSNCQNTAAANWTLDVEKSIKVDWQRVRIQESPSEIPAGSLPRSFDCIVRDEMVERVKAGDQIHVVGMLCVQPDSTGLAVAGDTPKAIQTAAAPQGKELANAAKAGGAGVEGYSQGVTGAKQNIGSREMTYKLILVASSVETLASKVGGGKGGLYGSDLMQAQNAWKHGSLLPRPGEQLGMDKEETYDANGNLIEADDDDSDDELREEDDEERKRMKEEEQKLVRRLRATPELYAKLGQSIAANIYGHMDVKHGVLLQLAGGVHKKTPEGIKLRGDINVCIVGDPSTAKSQFLKYVHGFSPRAVYTSGKAASAAGLTAAVVRDPDTGEFCVEAGALMLADNGICCIDEFVTVQVEIVFFLFISF